MNALNRSITGIFNGRQGPNTNIGESYLVNSYSGTKKFYSDLLKQSEIQNEITINKLSDKIDNFVLGQNLSEVISILSKQCYIIHRISSELKIVKYVKTLKKTELRVELHFFKNKLFFISICFPDYEIIRIKNIIQDLFPEIFNIEKFRTNQIISDNKNVLIIEDKLLFKLIFFNKVDIINYTKQIAN